MGVLPALPAAWPTGHLFRLRARGGFDVELDWAGSTLTQATLVSRLGSPARVRYGDQVREYDTRPGERIVFRP